MRWFAWNLVGFAVVALISLALANVTTTGLVNPCDAAVQLRFRAHQAPRPRPDGLSGLVECQRQVVDHIHGQMTGRLPHDQ